MYPHN